MSGCRKSRVISPSLQLYDPRTGLGQNRYRPLKAGDDLYLLAASLYWQQADLSAEARRASLYGLAEVWPRVQGRANHSDFRAAIVLQASRRGWTTDQLASHWQCSRDDMQKLIRRGRDREDLERDRGSEPQIDAKDGDPPSLEEIARVRCSDAEAQLRSDDFQRLTTLHQQVADVLGPSAPLALLAGPPSPEQLEKLRAEKLQAEIHHAASAGASPDRDSRPWWHRRPGDQA